LVALQDHAGTLSMVNKTIAADTTTLNFGASKATAVQTPTSTHSARAMRVWDAFVVRLIAGSRAACI